MLKTRILESILILALALFFSAIVCYWTSKPKIEEYKKVDIAPVVVPVHDYDNGFDAKG